MYYLNPASGVTVALRKGLVIDSPNLYRYGIFTPEDAELKRASRGFERYCFSGSSYEECGGGPFMG